MTEEKKIETREIVGVILLAGVLIVSGLLLIKQKDVPATFNEGQKNYSVPSTEKAATTAVTPQPNTSEKQVGLVNINKASLEELDTLPGVGPATAQKILDYRTANGGFKTIEDINNVSGIGEAKYSQIKDLIRI